MTRGAAQALWSRHVEGFLAPPRTMAAAARATYRDSCAAAIQYPRSRRHIGLFLSKLRLATRRARRRLALLALTFLLVFPAATALGAPPSDAFKKAACPFRGAWGVSKGSELVCGYVRVPERHDNPSGSTIDLAVAVFQSSSPTPAADPLVLVRRLSRSS